MENNTTEAIIPVISEKKTLSNYIRFDIVDDFNQFPFVGKLALVQKIPKDKIKSRDIGGKQVKYLPYTYCQKILNFLFNFKISNRIVKQEYYTYPGKNGNSVIEAEATVEFEFIHPDGNVITRTIVSSHKQFPNAAVNRGHAMSAAISKAWTVVAGTFGIGNQLEEEQDTQYDSIIRESSKEETPKNKKFYDFDYEM